MSKDQIDTFNKDGVILIKKALNSKQINLGRESIAESILNPGPHAEFLGEKDTKAAPQDIKEGNSNETDLGLHHNSNWNLFQDQYSSVRCKKMKQFIHESKLARIAAKVMQSTTASFIYDHVICKVQNNLSNQSSSRIPWHQDLPYWNFDGNQIVSVWIPFDEMSACASKDVLSFVIGSHKWGLFRPNHFVDATPYEGTEQMDDMPDIKELVSTGKATVQSFDVCPGDVLIFDSRIIHGSGPHVIALDDDNMNNNKCHWLHRRVALRFGGDDAIFYKRKGETAIPPSYIQHDLQHGDKVSLDGSFPILYHEESACNDL